MRFKTKRLILSLLLIILSSNLYAIQWLSNKVFTSTSLGRQMYYDAILPDDYHTGRRYPVLIMLHGRKNHYLTWRENSNLLNGMSATNRKFIVIMPEGENSWYMGPWFQYIAKDLVEYVMKTYRTCNIRGIDGFSMGGYGAFYVAGVGPSSGFRPYKSVGSMSGAFIEPNEAKALDGVKIMDRSDLAFYLAPKDCLISFDCGDDDEFKGWIFSYDLAHKNDLMRNDLITAGRILNKNLWYARPLGGKHDWAYWNSRIPEHLAFHYRIFKDYPVLSITSHLETTTYTSNNSARIAGTASATGGISEISYKITSGSKVTTGVATGTDAWFFDATNNVGKTVIRVTALSNYGTSCWAEIELFLRDTSYRIRKVIVKPRKIVAKTSDITYGDGNYLLTAPSNSFFRIAGYIFYPTNGVWKRNNDYVVVYKEKNENRVAKIKFQGNVKKDFILLNIKLKKKNTILPTNFWDVVPVNSDNFIDMEFGKYGEETNLFLDAKGKYKYKGPWFTK